MSAWRFIKIIYPAGFTGKGVFNKDLMIWLDGSNPPHHPKRYVCKYIVSKPLSEM